MTLLGANNLAVSFGAQDVFDGVDLELHAGERVALVGPNGCGKSTLLRIIGGLDQPTTGTVVRARATKVAYLEQDPTFVGDTGLYDSLVASFATIHEQAAELRRLEIAMANPAEAERAAARYAAAQEAFEAAGGYDFETRIENALSGLGLPPSTWTKRPSELSGGQRSRAALARTLLTEPDVLLLDEPTNHLDLEAMEWLEERLKKWPGGLVVVAHDRAFLDEVALKVWDLRPTGLDTYKGNYTAYVAQREAARERQRALFDQQAQEIAKTEDYIRRNLAGQNTRQAQGRRTRLSRLERLERPQDVKAPALTLGRAAPRSGDRALALRELTVGYVPGEPVLSVGDIEVMRLARVALIGPNGSGKTTLLRTITGDLPPLSGSAKLGGGVVPGYLSQTHANLIPDASALDHALGLGITNIGEARGLLGRFAFSGDEADKRVADMSGGERARLALALLSRAGANLLLLDEPTNHLDLGSQEVLQAQLAAFDGTLIVVTHDRALMRGLGGEVWAIEDGRVTVYPEGFDSYHDRRANARRSPDKPSSDSATTRRAGRAEDAAERRRAAKRSEAESRVSELEVRAESLRTALEAATAARDTGRIGTIGDDLVAAEAALERAIAAWMALDE